jgi:ssDNA-binding Zn-finger/Zn-ribbon topoisomerase 1
MAILICTYCGAEITAQSVETEDGHCPECGAIITLGKSNFGDDDDDYDEFDKNTIASEEEEMQEDYNEEDNHH